MHTKFDCEKHVWKCDDFEQRLDVFCTTLSQKRGKLMVITDFDRSVPFNETATIAQPTRAKC